MRSAHIFNEEVAALLYVKDYLLRGNDQLFLYDGRGLTACSAHDVASSDLILVTHDYGLVASVIFQSARKLPERVVDILEFHRATAGKRMPLAAARDTAFHLLSDAGLDKEVLALYSSIFYGRSPFESDTYECVAKALVVVWETLLLRADCLHEIARFLEVELVVFNKLWMALVKGIRIDQDRLRQHKKRIDDDYFRDLKRFAVKHAAAFVVPTDEMVRNYLDSVGMDVENTSVDYIISFLHFDDDYGVDLLALRKLARSRSLLLDLPVSHSRSYPLPMIAGTVTSRILLQGPSMQNLARRHRDIVLADEGMVLEYVDYAQFEVGIMVALAEDPVMREMYESGDLYLEVARLVFGSDDKRKVAKRLFLSYSYGMSIKRVVDAAVEQGGGRRAARDVFKSFVVFEAWKRSVQASYLENGFVSTSLGNNLLRVHEGGLTEKESRSCVSQVVQGNASLIFKRALIELSRVEGVDILIPMHDAILFQSSLQSSGLQVKALFEEVFARHFGGKVHAKAEIAKFF